MNRFWLKISGLVALIISLTIGVCVLWPTKSPDTKQTPQRETSALANQPGIEKPQSKHQLTPEDFQLAATSKLEDQNPRQQELRQAAVLLSTIYRNPHSPEAAKARRLLLKPPGKDKSRGGLLE